MFRFQPGEIVSVKLPYYDHYGMVSDRIERGEQFVISNSKKARRIIEEPLSKFAVNAQVVSHGYPSDLPSYEVIARAKSVLGFPYDLFRSNCEHFVRWVHGLDPESPQVGNALIFGAIAAGATVWILTRSES